MTSHIIAVQFKNLSNFGDSASDDHSLYLKAALFYNNWWKYYPQNYPTILKKNKVSQLKSENKVRSTPVDKKLQMWEISVHESTS